MARQPPSVPSRLVPLSADRAVPLELAREALWAAVTPGEDPTELWPGLESAIRDPGSSGATWERGATPVGLALWQPPSPLGVSVGLLYLRPPAATPEEYRDLFSAVERTAGPVAFAPSPLVGIPETAERAMMHGLGFAAYARSELVCPLPPPPVRSSPPPGRTVRPFRADDEGTVAQIHRTAYDGTFDRYLFLEDPDDARDARALVHDLLGGRWGAPRPDASMVVEDDGVPVGFTFVVDTPGGPLVADVATVPTARGRGVARSALEGTLASLFASGAPRARLAVTEGNRRAIALYERLGFVHHRGPSWGWYHTGRVPVSPDSD